jgi:HEAT repeat protein
MMNRCFVARSRIVRPTMLLALWLSAAMGFPAERSLQGLIDELQRPENASARFRAAESIVAYGILAVSPLRDLLTHEDVRVRACACSALGRLGPTAQDAIADLLAMARNPRECEIQRGSAVLALEQIGPPAASAVPVLQSLLRENPGPDLWRQIMNALAAIATEQALATVIESFDQVEGENREVILYALQRQGDKVRSVLPALLAASASRPDDPVGDEVFLLAATFGREATDAVVPYLKSPFPETRRRAAIALSRLGPAANGAVPILCGLTADESAVVRFWAARTLGSVGSDAYPAKDSLLTLLHDADPNVRWEAMSAIAKLDPTTITEDAWQRLLNDPEPGVRQRAEAIRSAIR